MNTMIRTGALLAALLAAPQIANAQETDAHAGHSMGAMEGASGAYMGAMEDMNTAMSGMAMTGDAGVDFAAMMIPHHQSAIDMAEAYLASQDQDPELTELATEIVAAQEEEIATLEDWLEANRPE